MANYLCTLRGRLASAGVGEIFSHSFAVMSNAEPSMVSTAVASSWNTVWFSGPTSLAGEFPTAVVYEEATAALILGLTDGRLGAAYHTPFEPDCAGSNTSGTHPTQVSVAVSFRAGFRPNGTPLKGRTYMPGLSVDRTDAATGLILSSAQNVLLLQWETFVNGLSAGGHNVAVWSRTMGAVQAVTQVRVGNRMDTIRSRRNSQAEQYQQADV